MAMAARCGAVLAVLALVGHVQAARTSVELSVNATLLSSGDWVRLTWGTVAEADREGCWVGVFSPADADVSPIEALPYPATAPWVKTHAIKYQYCSADPGFMASGVGSYNFTLLDMRQSVRFWLFTGSINTPTPVAKSDEILFRDPNAPRNGVIALTGNLGEMRVTWSSNSPNQEYVIYTVNGAAPVYNVSATSYTYTVDDMCGQPAQSQGWRDPGWFHTAVIKGLAPGKDTVQYRYGSNEIGFSDTKSFTAAQGPRPDTRVSIVATADVGATEADGCHYHWEEPDAGLTYQHLINNLPADFALHIGDISYATGYQSKWELFMHQAEPLGSQVPLMTGQGNHEQDAPAQIGGTFYGSNDSGGECGRSTEARFPMPTRSHDQFNGWYSFDVGNVHVLMMDTELECGPGSDQYDFFVNDLKAVNRSLTPWVIFAGHRPMYYVLGEGALIDPHFQAFEPLLMQYKVDLVLYGHVHNAFVSCPVYNGTCVTAKQSDGYDAPIHAVIGNGGQSLDQVPTKLNPFTVYQASEYGFSTIQVANATHLTMALYGDETGEEHFSFTVQRAFPRTA